MADRRGEPAGSRPEAAARAVDRCAEPVGRRLAPAEKEAAQAEPRAAFRAPSPSAALAAAGRGRWEVAAPFSAAFRVPSLSAAPAAAWQDRRDAARRAEAQPRAVAHAERLAPRDGAAPGAGAVQVAAPDAEVQAGAAVPGVAAAEVPAAQPWGLAWGLAWGLPSAAAWVFRQVPLLPWPARRPSVPTGRAMARSPTAWPSALWWQARPVLDFSCSFGSSGKNPGRQLRRGRSTNKRWAGLWRAANEKAYLFPATALFGRVPVHDVFRASFSCEIGSIVFATSEAKNFLRNQARRGSQMMMDASRAAGKVQRTPTGALVERSA